jgi:hypothetical protein
MQLPDSRSCRQDFPGTGPAFLLLQFRTAMDKENSAEAAGALAHFPKTILLSKSERMINTSLEKDTYGSLT